MQKRCYLLMDISVIITIVVIIVNIIIIIIVADFNISILKSATAEIDSPEVNPSFLPFFPGSTHPIRSDRQVFANILSAPIPAVISFRLTGRQ